MEYSDNRGVEIMRYRLERIMFYESRKSTYNEADDLADADVINKFRKKSNTRKKTGDYK